MTEERQIYQLDPSPLLDANTRIPSQREESLNAWKTEYITPDQLLADVVAAIALRLTQTQADQRYPLKTATDPYLQYLTNDRGDARYPLKTALSEAIDGRVAALLVAGTGVTLTYDDTANTLTVAATVTNEAIDDRVASLLVAGTGVTLTYDDTANTLTVAATVTNEAIDDRVAALLVAGAGVTMAYDDTANTLTISVVGGGGGGLTNTVITASSFTLAKNTRNILDCATAQTLTLPTAELHARVVLVGKGAGIWSVGGGVVYAPDGSNNNGVRRKATHRYITVELECIDATAGVWLIVAPSDLTGIELFDPSPYDADLDAYLTGLTGTPDPGRVAAVNAFLNGVKADGNYANILGFWVNLAVNEADVIRTIKGGNLSIVSGGAIAAAEMDAVHGYLPTVDRMFAFTPTVDGDQSMGFFLGVQKAPLQDDKIYMLLGQGNGILGSVNSAAPRLVEFPGFIAGDTKYENNLTGFFGACVRVASPAGTTRQYKNGVGTSSTSFGVNAPASPAYLRFTVGNTGGAVSFILYLDNPASVTTADQLASRVNTLATALVTG